MKGSQFIVIFLFFVFVQMALSDEITVTLQEGANGYTGCDDIHIGNASAVGFNFGANKGTSNKLVISNTVC